MVKMFDFRALMDTFLDALNTISLFLQYSWLSVCDTNTVTALARKLMDGIA